MHEYPFVFTFVRWQIVLALESKGVEGGLGIMASQDAKWGKVGAVAK